MRVKFREVEFAGNQEYHGADCHEPAVSAGLALGGLEQGVQGL